MVSLFALSLILGYTGNAEAATSAGELEQSLMHVAEDVKLSVVSITTVKVFKHPATGGYHGDQYGRGHGDGRGRGDRRDRRGGPFDDFFDKFMPKAPPKGEFFFWILINSPSYFDGLLPKTKKTTKKK